MSELTHECTSTPPTLDISLGFTVAQIIAVLILSSAVLEHGNGSAAPEAEEDNMCLINVIHECSLTQHEEACAGGG